MEHVKIQINSSEALQNLIGDNPEIRLEFKNRIVDTLIKDHIQPLLGQTNYDAILASANAEVERIKNNYISEQLQGGSAGSPRSGHTLNATTQKLLTEFISKELEKMISTKLCTERLNIMVKVEECFKRNERAIGDYITQEIDRRVYSQVTDRLNVMLSHLTDLSKYYATEKEKLSADTTDRKIELVL